jgi:hypothetical protein
MALAYKQKHMPHWRTASKLAPMQTFRDGQAPNAGRNHGPEHGQDERISIREILL